MWLLLFVGCYLKRENTKGGALWFSFLRKLLQGRLGEELYCKLQLFKVPACASRNTEYFVFSPLLGGFVFAAIGRWWQQGARALGGVVFILAVYSIAGQSNRHEQRAKKYKTTKNTKKYKTDRKL